jgi:DNA-binding CsgD family transcriptional regulator
VPPNRLDLDAFLRLIDLAYEAAQDPPGWASCLRALSDTLSARAAILLHHDLSTRGVIAESVGISPESLSAYNAHYHAIDVWALSPVTKGALVVGRAIPDEALVPRAKLFSTEHYTDFLRPLDLTRMVSLSLAREGQHSGITLIRGESQGGFAERELRFLEALIPHLRRALQVASRLRVANSDRAALLDSLDAVPCAALIVDGDSRVLFSNRAGTELRVAREGIGIEKGMLTTGSSDAGRKLRTLCAAAAGGAANALDRGGALLIARALDAGSLHVLVAPATPRSRAEAVHAAATALVFISDPLRDRPPREAMLQQYYGLTATEAAIAARLALGHDLGHIASERQITLETARWYSKQLLMKTGCANRAQLVRRLTRSLASLHADISAEDKD